MCWAIRGGWLVCQAPGSSLLLEMLLQQLLISFSGDVDAFSTPQQVMQVLICSN